MIPAAPTPTTSFTIKRRAVKAFKSYAVSKDVRRRYQRDWIAAIHRLGSNWRGVPMPREPLFIVGQRLSETGTD